MKQTKLKSILFGIVLAGILMPSFVFVFAQTPQPPPPPEKIPARAFQEANTKEKCAALGVLIGKFFAIVEPGNKYTTNYDEIRNGFTDGKAEVTYKCVLKRLDDKGAILKSQPPEIASYQSTFEAATVELSTANFVKTHKDAVAKEESKQSMWSSIFGFVFAAVLKIIAALLGAVANTAGAILSMIVKATNGVHRPEIVSIGWNIVRDFMNLFFILGLITIAIATILRIEAYNYKRLLVNLILMALLINFSKAIAEGFIEFFDMLMKLIAGSGDFFHYSNFFDSILRPGGSTSALFFSGGFTSQMVQGATSMVFGLIAIIAFMVIAAMLVIRMVGLWVMIILSPVAYALYIFPQTQGMARKWWSTFFKYLIWGPVAIFFLKLGDAMIISKSANKSFSDNQMFDFVMIGAITWAAVLVAKQAGMVGSSAIMGVADKSISKAKQWGKVGAGAAGSYFARGTAARHAGTFAGTLVGGQSTSLGRGLKAAGTATGKAIGAGTAKIAAAPSALAERFAVGNRERKDAIKTQMNNMLNNAGVRDKDTMKDYSPSQFMDMVKSGKNVKLKDFSKALDAGGKKASEAFMLAEHDGLIDGLKVDDEEKKGIKEAIYKKYAMDRGVKEFQFEQYKDDYMKQKPTAIFVGGLKEEDKAANKTPDMVLAEKGRWDNRRPFMEIPRFDQDGNIKERKPRPQTPEESADHLAGIKAGEVPLTARTPLSPEAQADLAKTEAKEAEARANIAKLREQAAQDRKKKEDEANKTNTTNA